MYDEDSAKDQPADQNGSSKQQQQDVQESEYDLHISLNGDAEDEEDGENEGAAGSDSNDELLEGAAFNDDEAARDGEESQSLAKFYGEDVETTALDLRDVTESAMMRQDSSYAGNDSQMEHSTNFDRQMSSSLTNRAQTPAFKRQQTTVHPNYTKHFANNYEQLQQDERDDFVSRHIQTDFQRQQTTVHPNYTRYFDINDYEQLQQDEQDDMLLRKQQADSIDENELSLDFAYQTEMGMTAYSTELEPVPDYQFIQVFGMERESKLPHNQTAFNVSGQIRNQNENRQADAANDSIATNNQEASASSNITNLKSNSGGSTEIADARQAGRALGESVFIMESPEYTISRKMV